MDGTYPSHWEADVVLRDGGTAHLRPITPADAEALREFHRRQSPESIYFRFFAPYPELSDRDVEHFTTVDHHDRVAFVALIGDVIVGVVRFDRIGENQAEVAFNVADPHQGRGLGSVLLEHAAAAARERGIRCFVAEVLPENRRMLGVFTDAGYAVTSDYEDGVVRLTFALEPTETSLAVMQAREHRAEGRSIERLLRPQSVAVVGASRGMDSIGQALLRHLVAGGFRGAVKAVNPAATLIAGVASYASVAEIPGPVDLAIVAVPADAVPEVVADCARKGVRGLVVVSSGYADSGPAGRERQQTLVTHARANGMRVVGPSSFGMINTEPGVRLNASLSPTMPAPGRVGCFAQSGALAAAILHAAEQRGLGLSTFVSAGNRADVSGNDVLQFWEEDPRTDVVLLYLESIGNPRKFSRLSRRVAARKPIVAVRSGRATQAAPLGHVIPASSVPPAAIDAMFRQSGVIRVENLAQLFDVAQLLATQPLPAGDRVAVLGNSAALGLLAIDACVEQGLRVSRGPIVVPAEASPEEFRSALTALVADPAVDSVVTVYSPPYNASDDELVAMLAAASGSTKTVVCTSLGLGPPRGTAPESVDAPNQPAAGARGRLPSYRSHPSHRSYPTHPTPDDAVRALAAVSSYAAWRRRPHGTFPELRDADPEGGRHLVRHLLTRRPEGTALQTSELSTLLAAFGVALECSVAVGTVDDAVTAAARIGYPVALKTTVEHLRHRPDLADVRLNLENEQQLRSAYAGLVATLGGSVASRAVVQRMAAPGVACVVASREDPLFGPILSFGLGGVATELLGDRAYGIPPVSDVDVAEMIRSVRAAPLLFGHKGADPVDTGALAQLLLRVSVLADELPEVAELELNPVMVGARGLVVLDGQGRVAPPRLRSDRGPRRLPG